LWGSVGWSLFAVISGGCVDWFSKGQEFKNYTVGYIISLICFILDLYVSTKLEASKNKLIIIVTNIVFNQLTPNFLLLTKMNVK